VPADDGALDTLLGAIADQLRHQPAANRADKIMREAQVIRHNPTLIT
jgi:hypothetical protein